MTAFNPGDPVHVAFDGVVTGEHSTLQGRIWVQDGDDRGHHVRPEHLSPVPTPVLFADIKECDRIRAVHGDAVIEDAVTCRTASSVSTTCYTFWNDSDWQFFRFTPPVPPEPEYEVGAVYQDAKGTVYGRDTNGWWRTFSGSLQDNDVPVRPLVRLVPEEPK